MTEKILCPWCGAEMRASVAMLDVYGAIAKYECGYCHACGPQRRGLKKEETSATARAAAMRHYTLPIKPMTLEEALECRTVWREYRNGMTKPVIIKEYWNGNLELRGYYRFRDKPERHLYGKDWRCWERNPTDEERSAAEWEI